MSDGYEISSLSVAKLFRGVFPETVLGTSVN
jgi:hypothetical protein